RMIQPQRAMSLDELCSCARPILWSGSSNEYPYTLGATCFLLAFHKCFFVVTVRHNIKDRTPRDILIPIPRGASTDLVPVSNMYSPNLSKDDEDTDVSEVLLMKLDVERVAPESLIGSVWLDFHLPEQLPNPRRGGKMLVAGFPQG